MQPGTAPTVSPFLRAAAAYAWRLIVVGVLVYGLFVVLGRFHEIAVAVFLGLVITALLRPVTDLVARRLPRGPAVAVTLLAGAALVLGVLTFVGEAVADEWTTLVREFRDGIGRIESWWERAPFRLAPGTLSDLQDKIGAYFSSHRSALVNTALSGAGEVVVVLTGLALAVFSSVFFLHSGERQWAWFQEQLAPSVRGRVAIAGRAAWRTFTGYTHGIVLVAATNAVLVGVALWLLGVPLAVPLALLEFLAAFIPLVGSPVALAVAAVVALAAKGPLVAGFVIALIVVIGQIEGHLLHPLVMSWAVRLHPLVVALAVATGAIAAGIVGAVVAVPLVSVVWSVHTALRDARHAPGGKPGERPDGRPGEWTDEEPGEGSPGPVDPEHS
ncbi:MULTISPECIES: AI-2E family transporter [unclassified Streptomyces]|uniref:AI-2E family transporter n=1 Tax=unclassified Streptomyces TaxID=2593676 RepID=UPI001660413B|nr:MULTISPECIES: AI-2E family transporter [unclassified Streptomyces]MBD0707083.1 AI-2E family transporter [Streptomyces sp. CBMA291]MBD0714340.1 AI-2E family transporter [Streptomyces sp. CBMA370]